MRISAKTGEGIELLIDTIAQTLRARERKIQILIPFSRYAVINEIRTAGRILEEKHQDNGTLITAMLEPSAYGRISSRFPELLAGDES